MTEIWEIKVLDCKYLYDFSRLFWCIFWNGQRITVHMYIYVPYW